MPLLSQFQTANLAFTSTESYIGQAVLLTEGLLGIFGIVLLLYATREDTNAKNKLIWSLCFADFLLVAVHSVQSISNLSIGGFAFGEAGCIVDTYIEYIAGLGSILSLVAITVERYVSIIMGRDVSEFDGWLVCAAIWIIDFLVISVTFFAGGVDSDVFTLGESKVFCIIAYWNPAPKTIASFYLTIVFVAGAMVIISYVYYSIFIIYRKINLKKSAGKREKGLNENEKKLFIKSVALVGFFTISYTPLLVAAVYEQVSRKPMPAALYTLTFVCCVFNSAFNPYLMILLDARIRSSVFQSSFLLYFFPSLEQRVRGSSASKKVSLRASIKSRQNSKHATSAQSSPADVIKVDKSPRIP